MKIVSLTHNFNDSFSFFTSYTFMEAKSQISYVCERMLIFSSANAKLSEIYLRLLGQKHWCLYFEEISISIQGLVTVLKVAADVRQT